MLRTLLLSITAFAATNVDDLLMDTLLFAGAATKKERQKVVAGKYLGMGALTALSVLGAMGLQLLPQRYIGCLGVVPIVLGVRELIAARHGGEGDETGEAPSRTADRMWNTALITVANGTDNIGVYVPLFAGFAVWQIVLSVGVFGVLVAVWCCLGKALADLPAVKSGLARYQTVIVPAVYIVLGVYILFWNFW